MQIYDMKSINREEMIELCYIMHVKKASKCGWKRN